MLYLNNWPLLVDLLRQDFLQAVAQATNLYLALGHGSSGPFSPLCLVLNLRGTEKHNYGGDVTGGLKMWLIALGWRVRRLLVFNITSETGNRADSNQRKV